MIKKVTATLHCGKVVEFAPNNCNLILGDVGSGKTTLLQSIALPFAGYSDLYDTASKYEFWFHQPLQFSISYGENEITTTIPRNAIAQVYGYDFRSAAVRYHEGMFAKQYDRKIHQLLGKNGFFVGCQKFIDIDLIGLKCKLAQSQAYSVVPVSILEWYVEDITFFNPEFKKGKLTLKFEKSHHVDLYEKQARTLSQTRSYLFWFASELLSRMIIEQRAKTITELSGIVLIDNVDALGFSPQDTVLFIELLCKILPNVQWFFTASLNMRNVTTNANVVLI